MSGTYVVTGALGYSGKAMAERLLARGLRVRTLTNSPGRPNPFGAALDVRGLEFESPTRLEESLRGAEVLINTYWVRFNYGEFSFERAVRNTRALFAAAKVAGVRRIVHVSILHPAGGKGLGYYEGKLELEGALAGLGVSHAVLRPGVLFGRGDILVNNIAWALRHVPVFGVFGDGEYQIQPMHVDDFADEAVRLAMGDGHEVVDAVGPEVFTYRGLVEEIARIIGVRRWVVRVPTWAGYAVARMLGPIVGDVVLTREEIEGLMRGLLASEKPSPGKIRLTAWAREHAATLGRRYASEVGRRVRRDVGYEEV